MSAYIACRYCNNDSLDVDTLSCDECGWYPGKPEAERLDELEREVRAVLETIPGAVRVCEGGGPENLAASLAVSVSKLVQAQDAAAAGVPRDAGGGGAAESGPRSGGPSATEAPSSTVTAGPIRLVEVRRQRGDLTPLTSLRNTVREIEEGKVQLPSRSLLILMDDAGRIEVFFSGSPHYLEGFGLLELGRHYMLAGCAFIEPEGES